MLIINGKEPGELKFDPHKNWRSERTFIVKPGATEEEIRAGIRMGLGAVLDDFKKFVHPRCWRYMKWFVKMHKPPQHSILGWKYEGRKINP